MADYLSATEIPQRMNVVNARSGYLQRFRIYIRCMNGDEEIIQCGTEFLM